MHIEIDKIYQKELKRQQTTDGGLIHLMKQSILIITYSTNRREI